MGCDSDDVGDDYLRHAPQPTDEELKAQGWRPSPHRDSCPRHVPGTKQLIPCDNPNVWVREFEPEGTHAIDFEVKCFGCGAYYRVDGPDA